MDMQGTFFFDPDDGIYEDHFPGNPVVPGTLIVSAFMEAGKQAGFQEGPHTLIDFRFKEFVYPGTYDFIIQIQEDRMQCRLCCKSSTKPETLVSGTIKRETWTS